jgi:hypothetical protein
MASDAEQIQQPHQPLSAGRTRRCDHALRVGLGGATRLSLDASSCSPRIATPSNTHTTQLIRHMLPVIPLRPARPPRLPQAAPPPPRVWLGCPPEPPRTAGAGTRAHGVPAVRRAPRRFPRLRAAHGWSRPITGAHSAACASGIVCTAFPTGAVTRFTLALGHARPPYALSPNGWNGGADCCTLLQGRKSISGTWRH